MIRLGQRPKPLRLIGPRHVLVRGRRLLYFAGCNYLRLSGHPAVAKAMAAALRRSPLGTGASRATTGEHEAYGRAEQAIARFLRQPAAMLTAAGYLAPIAAFQALAPMATHVLLDDAAHACVADGATLTGLPVKRFPHGDIPALRRLLHKLPRNARPIIACDGLVGSRGQFSPIAAYLAQLPTHGWLLVDDAHGFATAGPAGRGTVAAQGLRDQRIAQTISLSKALGMQGGAVIGSRDLIEAIYRIAPAFVGNTAPLVPVAVGIEAAMQVLSANPQRVSRLQANARALHDLLPPSLQTDHDPESPILAIYPPDLAGARKLEKMLLAAGIYPPWIRYLTGPQHGFFRFALSSEHRQADIKTLANAISKWTAS